MCNLYSMASTQWVGRHMFETPHLKLCQGERSKSKSKGWVRMNNKVLAVYGVATWVLSIVSSATDAAGNPVRPAILIIISAIATIIFVAMAVVRLWREASGFARGIAIALAASSIILVLSSFGITIVPVLMLAKVVALISTILAVIKLLRMGTA